jgi:hypothetical protein
VKVGEEKSSIMSDLRRELSLAGAKAYSACLLGRVARVGEEHRQAAQEGGREKRGREQSTLGCNVCFGQALDTS